MLSSNATDKPYFTAGSVAVAALVATLVPASAWAHDGEHAAPHELWSTWNWDALLLTGLVCAAAVYALGTHRAWKRAGVGRGIRRSQAACFAGGLTALGAALISPLDAVSDVLFSVHMLQHLILLLVASPLLVLGVPVMAFLWAIGPKRRTEINERWRTDTVWRSSWDALSQPLVVWLIYAGILWVWHAPPFFEAALQNDLIHELQHLSFLLAAMLFWWTVLSPLGRRRLDGGAGVVYLFTTSLHGSALGLLLTFSSGPWYSEYVDRSAGMAPLADQQLAGLIMWMPVCIVYFLAAGAICLSWLRKIDSRMPPVE